jgi:outer membrane lipopolysaccharide assembly protein LptE/RlpB
VTGYRLKVMLSAALALLTGCGYHVGGKAELMPSTVKTVAIPAFENISSRYKLSSWMPRQLTREFIARTRYEVVPEEEQADTVLRGAIIAYNAFPTTFDQVSGRASVVQMSVVVQLSLVERATGKVLFHRPALELRERYEGAVDQNAFFEESDVALERLSRDLARSVVSAILEDF